jgi:hypothetical protein
MAFEIVGVRGSFLSADSLVTSFVCLRSRNFLACSTGRCLEAVLVLCQKMPDQDRGLCAVATAATCCPRLLCTRRKKLRSGPGERASHWIAIESTTTPPRYGFPSVDAPFHARENVGVVAARGRMLSSVRPLMGQEDSRRPVWEFADRVQITQSVLEAQWKVSWTPKMRQVAKVEPCP